LEIEGTLNANLEAAVASAQRLRGRNVYKETLEYWEQLLALARHSKNRLTGAEVAAAELLIAKLDFEVMMRKG
jgi:hypothetical protein